MHGLWQLEFYVVVPKHALLFAIIASLVAEGPQDLARLWWSNNDGCRQWWHYAMFCGEKDVVKLL